MTPEAEAAYAAGRALARSGENVVGRNPYRFRDWTLSYFWDLGWLEFHRGKIMRFQVIVSNIGTVYDGDDDVEAKNTFQLYAEQSADGIGRAAYEDVTLLQDGEPRLEYMGSETEDKPPRRSPLSFEGGADPEDTRS